MGLDSQEPPIWRQWMSAAADKIAAKAPNALTPSAVWTTTAT